MPRQTLQESRRETMEQGDDRLHVEVSGVVLGAGGVVALALVVGTIWKTIQVLGTGMREMPM